jgi:hypothetical protein
MEARPYGLMRLFSLTPKTILLAMSPVLMLFAFLAWLILGSAVVAAQTDSPPRATLHFS